MHRRWPIVAFLLASLGIQYWAHATYQPSRPTLKVEIGAAAPAWSFEDLDGRRVSSEDFRNRVVILDFWATWCAPCRKEFEALNAWWRREQASGLLDGVELLAVNVGEPPDLIGRFVESNPIRFRVVRDGDGSVAQSLGVTGLPALIMLDRQGRVRFTELGYDPLVGASLSDTLRVMTKERAE